MLRLPDLIDEWTSQRGWDSVADGDLNAVRAVYDIIACDVPVGAKLPADAGVRLAVAGGLLQDRKNPIPPCAEALRTMCAKIFYAEATRGFEPVKRGARLYVPWDGWHYNPTTGRAIPVASVKGRFWSKWSGDWRLEVSDPFTRKLFDIAELYGERSPDRCWPGWLGPDAVWIPEGEK